MASGGQRGIGQDLVIVGKLRLKSDDLDPMGVVVVGDKLVITDRVSNKVHVYRRHDGMLLSSTDELESDPNGLCRVSDTEFCVAMNDGIIAIMSVQDSGLISRGKTFHLRPSFDHCCGVALWNDNIVVIGVKDNTICWCVVSLKDGRPDKLHKVCGGNCISFLTVTHDMVYITCQSDSNDDIGGVYGFNLLNPSQPTYRYKQKGLAFGITVNDIGHLFVCNYLKSIHHLTEECELVAIYKNGIPRFPFAIFWDSGVLYLASDGSNKITMYKTPQQGMIAFKGRHKAKQYLPSKPIKWGLKVWMRCDSLSGFCHQFEFYQGKEDTDEVNQSMKGLGYRVVQKLTMPLRGKFYHVYFDNFFTSIRLVRSLFRHGIYACGTMRKNRKGFPEEFKYPPYMEQGDHLIKQDGNLAATLWKDKKPVTVLSTAADPTIICIANRKQKNGTVQLVNCPKAVTNYQQYYRGVDICDQLRAKYPVGRSSKKWWRYMFHFIMNICIINGFITMVESHPESQGRRKRFRQLDFRINLAKQLIGSFKSRKVTMHRTSVAPVTQANIETHRLQTLKRKKSTCKYCIKHGEKRRRETKIGCVICNVHLCCIECHSLFHQNMIVEE